MDATRRETPVPEPLGGAFDPRGDGFWTERRIGRATWAFVALGVGLRLARYAADFPLWGDEAFVAVNFLDRGYRDLLRPLDYDQICPLLFLWIELTAVKCLGFSELSLRAFPLLCGAVSVPLFGHAAGRLLRGWPRLLAVAIFAVSFHPIRHAAEVKPYASDLLASLLLLVPALAWWRAPARTGWLWALAALAPPALGLSHPAVFVAGGVALGLAAPVWTSGRRAAFAPFAAFLAVTAGTFLILFAAFADAQGRGALRGLQAFWAYAFPPLDSASRLAGWLLSIHTGTLFAYPWGGARGLSTATTLCVAVGAATLWRRGLRAPLAMLLTPFLLTFVAACLRRYPYGGEARQMQFVAPAICLLTGLGAAALVRAVPRPGVRPHLAAAGLLVLGLAALAIAARDRVRPYRFLYDHQAREFARRFWPAQERDAEVACLSWDFRIRIPHTVNLRTALYLCNQGIYSPRRREGTGPRWRAVSAVHPLRCVEYHDLLPDSPEVAAWLRGMRSFYELRRIEPIQVNASGAKAGPRAERLYIYEFVPKPARPGLLASRRAEGEGSRQADGR